MRKKHHYTIKKTIYTYVGGDYLEDCEVVAKETVIFTTNKRAKAEDFYYGNLWQERGTEYKGCYYPYVEISFQRDY